MGKALAINDANSKIKYDMVVPVPDSGVPAALGYAAYEFNYCWKIFTCN